MTHNVMMDGHGVRICSFCGKMDGFEMACPAKVLEIEKEMKMELATQQSKMEMERATQQSKMEMERATQQSKMELERDIQYRKMEMEERVKVMENRTTLFHHCLIIVAVAIPLVFASMYLDTFRADIRLIATAISDIPKVIDSGVHKTTNVLKLVADGLRIFAFALLASAGGIVHKVLDAFPKILEREPK